MASIGFTFSTPMGYVGYRASQPRTGFMPLAGGYAPSISNQHPGASIDYATEIGLDLNVAPGFSAVNVVIQAALPNGAREVVYSGGSYRTGYTGSTSTLNNGIVNTGTRFRFSRTAGFFEGSWSLVVAASASDSSTVFEQSMAFTAAAGGSGVVLSSGVGSLFVNMVNCSAGARTLNLPTAVGISGRTLIFKKTDATANEFTLDPNGSETIDGNPTATVSGENTIYKIQSNGSNWIVV